MWMHTENFILEPFTEFGINERQFCAQIDRKLCDTQNTQTKDWIRPYNNLPSDVYTTNGLNGAILVFNSPSPSPPPLPHPREYPLGLRSQCGTSKMAHNKNPFGLCSEDCLKAPGQHWVRPKNKNVHRFTHNTWYKDNDGKKSFLEIFLPDVLSFSKN